MTRPRPGRWLLPALLTLLLAACSGAAAAPSGVATIDGAAGSADPGATPAASLAPEDAMLAFAECMREQGIDFPDPQVGGQGGAIRIDLEGIDPEELQAAQETCGDILGQAGVGPGASLSPEEQDQLVAFAECMREHGIDLPDPDSGGGIIIGGAGGGIDPGDPDFQAAQEACADLLPFRGPNGQPGGGDGPATDEQAG